MPSTPLGLSILYRGPLSSCNYDCHYCPFAKTHNTAAELKVDRECLSRFVDWIASHPEERFSVFFTPWGEGLTRRWYREAMHTLSHLPHVGRVAIQTNLSCDLDWLTDVDHDTLALWCTYHPSQVTRDAFVAQCAELRRLGIRFSVGTVAMRTDFAFIEELRAALPEDVYVWVNAAKSSEAPYSREEIARLSAVDPLFERNTKYHPSLGKACRTGEDVISVDGDGVMRRCHFVETPIGNIYAADWKSALQPRPCPNATCGCHIGYVHLPELGLREVFGDGLLERVPTSLVTLSRS